MIFGKNIREQIEIRNIKDEKRQAKLKRLYRKEYKKFCFIPHVLEDGRWVWLEFVYRRRIDIELSRDSYVKDRYVNYELFIKFDDCYLESREKQNG